MKKILIVLITLLLSACQSESLYETKIKDARHMNESIRFEESTFEVIQVSANLLGYSVYPNEDLIYVFFEYSGELSFTSNDIKVMLENGEIIDAYMVDGLDYLTGPAQASNPYVRFSLPQDTNEMLLVIKSEVYIHLVWE